MTSLKGSPSRLLIYAHYNPQGLVSDYVFHSISEMRKVVKSIIFVSNSALKDKDEKRLLDDCDDLFKRENKGFDFAAWRDVLKEIGWESLESFDSLLLMNDTCFGPIFDISDIFYEMEKREADFWGLTNNEEHIDRSTWQRKIIPKHLQSYFTCFPKKTFRKKVFQRFFENIEDEENVNKVVEKYEIGLTKTLEKAGLHYESYVNADDRFGRFKFKVAFLAPDLLLKAGSPMVKVKSFFFFDHPEFLKKQIRENSTYDTTLIDNHIYNSFGPEKAVRVSDKKLLFANNESEIIPKKLLDTAIHIHVYFMDIFKEHLSIIRNNTKSADLYITTDSQEKADELRELTTDFEQKKEIIVFENRGRDVLPWLKISEKLSGYEICAHLHLKKSTEVPEWVGKSWMDDTFSLLLNRLDEITNEFKRNENLGIVIPDVPQFFKLTERILYDDEEVENTERYLRKVGVKNIFPENSFQAPVMAYGNMFIYRPNALKPLLDGNIKDIFFPKEPIPPKNTVAHIIERLPVYVAWSEGYDFRIAMDTKNIMSGFAFQQRSKLRDVKKSFYDTWQWKIGRVFTFIPGLFKRYIRNRNKSSKN
jgi:rhamnosyltransferase